MAESKVFFPNLDGLRFFAFFNVFLHHGFLALMETFSHVGFVLTTIKIAVFQSSHLGVSFFFVLSGFLITYLILSEIKLKGQLDVIAFYIRRVLRIWPLYYLLLFYAFVAHPLVTKLFGLHGPHGANYLYYYFFLSNFDVLTPKPHHYPVTDVTWSVAVEEQFYLTWPLFFRFVNRRFYIFIFIGIIVASAWFRWMYRFDSRFQYFHTFSVISDMAIGGLCAYLSINYPKFREFFANLERWKIIAVYCVGALFLTYSRFLFMPKTAVAGRLILGVIFAFIILEQNYAKNSILKLSQFEKITTLGKYTYGLYLLHPIAVWYVVNICIGLNINVAAVPSGLIVPLVSFALSVAVSLLSYHFYENRFLRLKQRFAYVKSHPPN
jgi:peptidoglycan/LPS O-acetylase OafA/YrhL